MNSRGVVGDVLGWAISCRIHRRHSRTA
jgi:hypothetical protein